MSVGNFSRGRAGSYVPYIQQAVYQQNGKSKEAMYAVILAVKMHAINTAVLRSHFSVPKGWSKVRNFYLWNIVSSEATLLLEKHMADSLLTGHHVQVLDHRHRSSMEPGVLHFRLLNWIYFSHVKGNKSVYNLISDVKVHHSMSAVTDSVYVSIVQIYNYLTENNIHSKLFQIFTHCTTVLQLFTWLNQ